MSDSKHAYPLILNKVASPHYATPTLRRGRLIEWLDAASECRAAVIAADAGYGKTTLLWQWEREARVPVYWYKLDRSDRDWTFHVSYLIEAIGKRHRGFGRRANSMLQQLGGPGSARPGVVAYLLAEMHQRLTEPCTFIIDDWQYVNAATEVRGLWNQILRDAPATCRFIFASRVKPRLQFARFKTHAGYAELRTDAMRFTEAEIDELFRDIYNDPLAPTELAELERKTEGWAASLQLVEVSLRERSTTLERQEFIGSITATGDIDLFEFLAEEVLDQQRDEIRNFLLATSILHQITPEVAERLAGVHDGQHALVDLESRGLFTSRLDESRYRYHNLFREFLERRLRAERSEAEVVGLHIHAASYFETTEQWPEAIHHYLRAGLQRQAARLIAKHGEGVVSTGRLGLVDEWLQRLPPEAIRQNARLNLLYGEAAGIRGNWSAALGALQKAREFFARKGDRRLEALTCLKLSSVHSNFGDAESAADLAEAGLSLVPSDDVTTRLRLRGNLAITRSWLSGSLAHVADECLDVAREAERGGLDHFAAIGYHNAGEMLMRQGRIQEAIASLEKSTSFWSETPTSPFGHCENFVSALIADGQLSRAREVAVESVRRTAAWSRPNALAMRSYADVLAADGQFREAADAVRIAAEDQQILGNLLSSVTSARVESLYLGVADPDQLRAACVSFEAAPPVDPRHRFDIVPAQAVSRHVLTRCVGECQELLVTLRRDAEKLGALENLVGRVKVGALAFDHRAVGPKRAAWEALTALVGLGYVQPVKWWARRYVEHAELSLAIAPGAQTLAGLLEADPEGWRSAAIGVLPSVSPEERASLLTAIARHATRDTVTALRQVPGADVTAVTRRLQYAQASRLFLRTFGGLSIHRGGWDGPAIRVEKRRIRSLLGVLAAHTQTALTREMAADLMWPDSDGDSAINSLNQTVFQLRRLIDPDYRQGESPEYIVSTAEQLKLAEDLVRTDLAEVRGLSDRLAAIPWARRQAAAKRTISLVQGEFLADLRYESWASRLQMGAHNDVRSRLLPIATGGTLYDIGISIEAADVLLRLDPLDEVATVTLANLLERSGRRRAARDILVQFAEQAAVDLDGELPEGVAAALARHPPSKNQT